ncbi:hypothetical protein BDR22DRAFT_854596 [Usnea florida]
MFRAAPVLGLTCPKRYQTCYPAFFRSSYHNSPRPKSAPNLPAPSQTRPPCPQLAYPKYTNRGNPAPSGNSSNNNRRLHRLTMRPRL